MSKLNSTRTFIVSSKSNVTKSRSLLKTYVKRAFFGVGTGFIAYDVYNDFEVFGGATRFLRSMKIAALISIDYTYNLYGLQDGSDTYEQVKANVQSSTIQMRKCKYLHFSRPSKIFICEVQTDF